MNTNYLIGRQPILNRSESIVGYELLFRSKRSGNFAEIGDASQATANVIINSLASFGLEAILGPHRGFVNLELDMLMSDSIFILPKERIVLELLETLQITPEMVDRCRVLKDSGFILALDDHTFDPIYEELYSIVDIVKIDLMQTSGDLLAETVKQFSAYPITLLAEKVETREEFNLCRDLGFELFQGYYFARPAVLERKSFDDSQIVLLKLMQLLNDEAEVEAIEKAFRESPGMTYKLLLLVNSVSTGVRVRIQNIRQAVVTLGRQQIKRWIQLALFSSDNLSELENPLIEMAAVRAAFMEQLTVHIPQLQNNPDAVDHAFMTGILSLLEAIYAISIHEITGTLVLSDEVKDALTSRTGIFGSLLNLVELVERMEFQEALLQFEALGLSEEDVIAAQMKAYNWRDALS